MLSDDPTAARCEAVNVPFFYADPAQVPREHPAIIVVPWADDALQQLLHAPSRSLDWLSVENVVPRGSKLPFDSIPILFWGQGCQYPRKPFAEQRSDGSVVFYADIIATVFFLLSRWEETLVSVRDTHGRFPATASASFKQGFLERPIVDEYALALREWVKIMFPQWEPKVRKFCVKLSHDVDSIRWLPNFRHGMKKIVGDLLKQRSPKLAWETFRQSSSPWRDPYFRGVYDLADLSNRYRLSSAFYFMATDEGHFDSGYDVAAPLVRRCIQELRDRGFEIGFHASYHTLGNPVKLAVEKERLDNVLGETRYGGRQHYLRFQVPATWRDWEQVGLSYDSTMTYADYEGFRCGTCHPFPVFDVEQNRELDLWEWPLVVMDGTLRRYRGLTPEQAEIRILELARQCKQVEGVFTLLWHNSSLSGEWRPWAEVYERAVRVLAQMQR